MTTADAPEPEPWGALLQDKYVNAHAVACCPTMDLIAIVTTDRELVVHRTVSWQKAMHVKAAELALTIDTIAWSPDGMRLAAGGDEGEIAVFDIATAQHVELRTPDSTSAHASAIVDIHWMQPLANAGAGVEAEDARLDAFRSRHSRLQPPCTAKLDDSQSANVLWTADRDGRILAWWQGVVHVATIDIAEHLVATLDRERLHSRHGPPCIKRMRCAPDLMSLFVFVKTTHANFETPDREVSVHHLLQVNLENLCAMQRKLESIVRVAQVVNTILADTKVAARQIHSEWKNATRVFELKMSLLGSLYEKYGNEEPPQADMLAVITSGITSPALAQYFAQDIQEMSVHRIHKLFMSGCDNVQTSIREKLRPSIQRMIFQIAELRGMVSWDQDELQLTSSVVGTENLATLLQQASSLLLDLEHLHKAVEESRQDFGMLFRWILQRIRVHTNSSGNRSIANPNDWGSSACLLNERRLCEFMERACHRARQFQESQSSKFKVEVSFANTVSELLSKQSLSDTISALERTWTTVMKAVSDSSSRSITPNRSWGKRFDTPVRACRIHFRTYQLEDEDVGERDSFNAVDWGLLHSTHTNSVERETQTICIVALVVDGCVALLVLDKSGESVVVAKLPGSGHRCLSIDFYGGHGAGKMEHIVVAEATTALESQAGVRFLLYDDILRAARTIRKNEIEVQLQSMPILVFGPFRARPVPGQPRPDKIWVTAQAARGVVCILAGNRLSVVDAEDTDGCEDANSPCDDEDSDVNEQDL